MDSCVERGFRPLFTFIVAIDHMLFPFPTMIGCSIMFTRLAKHFSFGLFGEVFVHLFCASAMAVRQYLDFIIWWDCKGFWWNTRLTCTQARIAWFCVQSILVILVYSDRPKDTFKN